MAGNGLLPFSDDAQTIEALSLREVLSWAKDQGMVNVVFEIDAQSIVKALPSCSTDTSYSGMILQDCNAFLSAIGAAHLVFVKRYANMVAHSLARAACSKPGLQQWTLSPPDLIVDVLFADLIS